MKMRKLLSLVLASSMVVSSFSMSFAAPVAATTKLVENVEDANVVKAVQRLNAFGIVDGMDDGEYHPEIQVTREQMAKLIVEALGLESAVPAAKGTTSFKDVNANGWATGYINVAYGQGIIKGTGDGNFNPTGEVTYAEAITMLVRALGYKDQFISDRGAWPSNYIAQAADLDITDGVTYAATGANRGDVAIMLNNTLDANVVEAVSYGRNIVQGSDDDTRYATTDKSLLEDKLGFDKVSDLRIVGTPSLLERLEENEVTLKAIKDDVVIDGKDLKEGHEKPYDTKVATNYLLGEDVTGYFDGDEMVYVETETDQDNVFRAPIKNDDDKAEDVVIDGVDGKFGWDDNAVVYINNEKMDFDFEEADKADKIDFEKDNLESDDSDYIFARKVVVENGDIMFLDAVKFETENINMVVKSVNKDKERINVFETYNGDEEDRDLKLDDYDDGFDIFTEEGIELGLEDLEKNDVIYLAEENDEDRVHVIVANKRTVTGDLDDYRQGYGNKGKDTTSIKIDGESYDLADHFTFTDDDLDTLKGYGNNDGIAEKNDDADLAVMYNKFEDIFGEEITILRDLRGKVAFINSSVDATVDNYAVVLGADERYGDVELKVWNTEGVESYYKVDNDKLPLKNKTDLPNGTIIKYDLTSNGDKIKIEEAYIVANNKVTIGYEYKEDSSKTVLANYKMLQSDLDDVNVQLRTSDTFEKDSIKTYSGTYYNEADSVYLNYADYNDATPDEDDLEIFAWDELEGNEANGTSNVLVLTDKEDNDVELMVFLNDSNIAGSKLFEGYVAKVTRSKNTKTVEIDVVGEGTKTYVVDDNDSAYSKIVNETPIVFTEKGSSIKLVEDDKNDSKDKWTEENYVLVNENFTENGAMIKEKGVDGRYITLTTEKRYKLAADAVIYNDSDEKDKSDLVAGSGKTVYVRFIAQGSEILALQYSDFDTSEGPADETDTTVDFDKLLTKATDFATVPELDKYVDNVKFEIKLLEKERDKDSTSNAAARVAQNKINQLNDVLEIIADKTVNNVLTDSAVKTELKAIIAVSDAKDAVSAIETKIIEKNESIVAAQTKISDAKLEETKINITLDEKSALDTKITNKVSEVDTAIANASITFNYSETVGEFVVATPETTLTLASATTTTGSAIELVNKSIVGMNKEQLEKHKEDLQYRATEIKAEILKIEAKIVAQEAIVTEETNKISTLDAEILAEKGNLATATGTLKAAEDELADLRK